MHPTRGGRVGVRRLAGFGLGQRRARGSSSGFKVWTELALPLPASAERRLGLSNSGISRGVEAPGRRKPSLRDLRGSPGGPLFNFPEARFLGVRFDSTLLGVCDASPKKSFYWRLRLSSAEQIAVAPGPISNTL
jgi:hypothetical protein